MQEGWDFSCHDHNILQYSKGCCTTRKGCAAAFFAGLPAEFPFYDLLRCSKRLFQLFKKCGISLAGFL